MRSGAPEYRRPALAFRVHRDGGTNVKHRESLTRTLFPRGKLPNTKFERVERRSSPEREHHALPFATPWDASARCRVKLSHRPRD